MDFASTTRAAKTELGHRKGTVFRSSDVPQQPFKAMR